MRQKPIGDYIVDFFCSKLKLVIEIDGISHNDKSESDQIRQQKLESMGLSLLRFYEWDVKKDIHAVVEVVEVWIEKFEKKTQPPVSPFSKGDFYTYHLLNRIIKMKIPIQSSYLININENYKFYHIDRLLKKLLYRIC